MLTLIPINRDPFTSGKFQARQCDTERCRHSMARQESSSREQRMPSGSLSYAGCGGGCRAVDRSHPIARTRASGAGSSYRLARPGQDKCRISVDVDGKREPKKWTSLGSDRGASRALRRPLSASWSRISAKMGTLRRDCRPPRTSSEQGQRRLGSDVPRRWARGSRRCRHPD